jgi:site-specific DNA recombinase
MTGRNAPNMKLDGYIRVSRVGGRSGDSFISPEVQREQIARYAQLHGHEVVAFHEDLDQSGGTIKRPGFQAMLARIEGGETDGVLVPRLDRFGRSVPRIYEALERIQEAGGQLLSVAEEFNLSTAAGKAHFNMLGMMAQYQRDLATEAWDASNRRAIERGIHFTRVPPFGYLRGEDRRLVPDPATAPLVREMFQRRAVRGSWRAIAAWLNETHPRDDGRSWTSRNIATMVKNRAYVGEAFHGEHRNANAHEAIVTLPEWDAANAVKGGPGAIHERSALLAGLIRCAGCRYAMRRTFVTKGNGERAAIYSCQRKHTGGDCPAPANVLAHLVEGVVAGRVLAFMGDMTWNVGDDDGGGLEEAERQLAHAEGQLAAFLADDELRDVVGRDSFLAEARKRQRAVDAARERAEEAKAARRLEERRRYVLREEWAKWQGDGEELRADTLRSVLETVYVRKGRGPVQGRVLLRWDGEDRYERPRRGTTSYVARPIPWPPTANAVEIASIPEWAWRNGHPVIEEGWRAEVHEMARREGLPWYLPDSEAA